MTSINDHKNSDGGVNWESYHQAQVANGESCLKCSSYITSWNGAPSLCYSCRAFMQDSDEVEHQKLTRCPRCEHQQNPYPDYGWPSNHALGSEEDMIDCNKCEHVYRIGLRMELYYKSPELEDGGKANDG